MTDKEKDPIEEEYREIVSNIVVMAAIGRSAHPEAEQIINALQDSTIALIALSKGPGWLTANDDAIGKRISARTSQLQEVAEETARKEKAN